MEAKLHTSTLEESAIIERVARIVFSVRGTKPDYARLAGELEQAVPFDIFGVVLLRHDRQAARVIVCQREDARWVARLHQRPLTDSMLERVMSDPAIHVNNYPNGLDGDPATSGDALSSHNHLRSTLIAPLMVEDRVLGSLELGSTALNTYAEGCLQRLVSAVVRVLAAAIESVQLGGNAAIQDRQRKALKDVTSALTAKNDLTTVLGHIVDGVSNALNVSSFLVLQERQHRHLRLVASSGLEQELLSQVFHEQVRFSEKSILWQTLKRRQPLEAADLTSDERYEENDILLSGLGLRSIYCYPLMTATAIYGVLVICSRENGGFTPLKTDILTLFANQATVALHNAVLLDTTRQRNRFQQAVEQLEQTLHHEDSEFTPELERAELELLRQVRGEMQRTFGISLGNLLQRMGRHMTTLHERDPEAYAVIHASQEEFFASPATSQSVYPLALPMGELEQQLQVTSDENQALLERAADAALSNAAMLGELSRLIMQLEHSTNWVRDAWLVVDLSGTCRYMNPAAQRLCGVNLEQVSTSYNGGLLELPQGQISAYQLTDVFARLLPRIRNREEVHSYLEAFTRECDGVYGLRCVLAEEPCDAQTIEQERASDHYYKLTRYPLYTQQGAQLEAGALQIQDVTEQVRDERNRSALFSAVSHDLRTPLTTIKAAVTGLLEPDMPWEEQERREVLEEIDSEADRLTVMVTSLVELSRIEVGALNLKKEWCDVAEVFHGIWPRIRRVLANRQLGTQFQEPLPLIYADHAQLGSVLFYLIENAARHSPDHSTIVVDMHVIVEDTTEKLRIQVIDHGIEIPEHEREKVFTAFHMQEQNYGNGLSLTICKRIVEAHQGKIWVESTNGGGSCFVFTLPIHSHSLVHMGEKVPVRIEGDAGSKVRGK